MEPFGIGAALVELAFFVLGSLTDLSLEAWIANADKAPGLLVGTRRGAAGAAQDPFDAFDGHGFLREHPYRSSAFHGLEEGSGCFGAGPLGFESSWKWNELCFWRWFCHLAVGTP